MWGSMPCGAGRLVRSEAGIKLGDIQRGNAMTVYIAISGQDQHGYAMTVCIAMALRAAAASSILRNGVFPHST